MKEKYHWYLKIHIDHIGNEYFEFNFSDNNFFSMNNILEMYNCLTFAKINEYVICCLINSFFWNQPASVSYRQTSSKQLKSKVKEFYN